jgi:uncharacterized FAD-dependent dehydrogenase
MQQVVSITITPQEAASINKIKKLAALKAGISDERVQYVRIQKKSIDARHRDIFVNLTVLVFIDELPQFDQNHKIRYQDVSQKPTVIVVGAGPAGLFAALKLIESGLKPIVFERGKEVSERKKDVALISKEHLVNPNSNYCFGEGGAGTFSDGKLYTRSNKRGNVQRIYEIFHQHGAADEILYEAHPHIGTDKLPDVIKNIRNTILQCGGEVHFGKCVDEILLKENDVIGIRLKTGEIIGAKAIILATGHSARDVYRMLFQKNIALEAKSFAVGVRVEHQQELIDHIQYHGIKRGDLLPAASYSLAEQINGRGVFSFCMCPGGFIVPSATEQNQVVVNGMSASKRNSPYANSGIVVEVKPEDLSDFKAEGILAGIAFQEYIEGMAWQNGGRSQTAPAQRLMDFVKGRMSSALPGTSYFPGVISSPVHMWLPGFIAKTLQEGFKKFDKKMHGFLTNEAIILGVESRTSSPVRIPRNKESYEHISIKGLFPCGEGAGYAGGIASSAMDGENSAEKVAAFYNA